MATSPRVPDSDPPEGAPEPDSDPPPPPKKRPRNIERPTIPAPTDSIGRYRVMDDFRLADLESVRLVLRGGSVIDWYRMNFQSMDEVHEFIHSQEIDQANAEDRRRTERVRDAAISYLRRNYEFPIPKPVAHASLDDLLLIASSKGHRQLCACTILKVMHIIHHLEARELLFTLATSDQEVFQLVEQKVYRVMGAMLARGLPIVEVIGGRKNKDSLYTKLLSKRETIAAQIYDKVRFRIVTRSASDIFPTLNYLMRHLFPFNYAIPGESTNTLFQFRKYCKTNSRLAKLFKHMQLAPDIEEKASQVDNRFTASTYRVVQFVADVPVQLPDEMLRHAPLEARGLGRVVFVQTEFQVIDRDSEQVNELGEASHAAYKQRQKLAVMRRLKVGSEDQYPVRPPVRRKARQPTEAAARGRAAPRT